VADQGMSYHLGRAARGLREQRGLTLMDIATRAGVSESVVSAFESGKGWRRRTDEIVAAYALELGVQPDDVWQGALDAWRRSR
jgi:transcriptional regulator with XRE-family HTH domain